MKYSISQISAFKACRRAYQLRYKEGVVPNLRAEALEVGTDYHGYIERLYMGEFEAQGDISKAHAMACAYQKHIYPLFKVQTVEESFEYPLTSEDTLIGRVDGIAEDGSLVEHKSTGLNITEQYEYDLLWNEQLLAYMLAYGVQTMYYTICKKPTIRQKKDETEQEFHDRMVAWYDEDTENKIKILKVFRTEEEIQQFKEELIHTIEIEKSCQSDLDFYKCTGFCNMWGKRCEYSAICLNYDPQQEYCDFHREERRNDGIKKD